jgi:hypothetical protein
MNIKELKTKYVGAVLSPTRWMIKKNCSSRLVRIPGEAPVNASTCPFVSTTDAQAVEYGRAFSGHKPISPNCTAFLPRWCVKCSTTGHRGASCGTASFRRSWPVARVTSMAERHNHQGACLYVTPAKQCRVTQNKECCTVKSNHGAWILYRHTTCYFYSTGVYTRPESCRRRDRESHAAVTRG